jgi:hypothetical protein
MLVSADLTRLKEAVEEICELHGYQAFGCEVIQSVSLINSVRYELLNSFIQVSGELFVHHSEFLSPPDQPLTDQLQAKVIAELMQQINDAQKIPAPASATDLSG